MLSVSNGRHQLEQSAKKVRVLLIYIALALAVVIAFEQVRRNKFVYDDEQYIVNNPHIHTGITRESVVWAFTSGYASNWHPLTWLSHMLDCQLFELNPFRHHMTNLLFHILNTLLLFWILKRMTGMVWHSGFVAAAFALHPLHVESVAWVAERKDVLSGFFWMLTMAAYLRYVKHPNIRRYLLVVLAFALGLMAKPMLITLPFVLLLLDYWPLERFQPELPIPKKASTKPESAGIKHNALSGWYLIVEKIPLFFLTLVSGVITFMVQQSGGSVVRIGSFPLDIRIANGLVSYIKYIAKMIYPSGLAVLYPHPGNSLPAWQPMVSFVMLTVLSAVIIYMARRKRYLAVGWLWYLGTLVPVIGLVQVGAQAMADRYTYLPSIGIFIMVAWGAVDITAKWRYQKIVLGISTALIVVVILLCSRTQVSHWQNEITLYEHALEVTENNPFMHNNLGTALLAEGKSDEAIMHFRRALQIKPSYLNAHINLGSSLLKRDKPDEAIMHFRKALDIEPEHSGAHNNLGTALAEQGRLNEAIKHFRKALDIEPEHSGAHNNLGTTLAIQGKLDEAIRHFRKVLQIKPDHLEAHNNLGTALLSQGKSDEAIGHFRRALQIKPNHLNARNNYGEALLKKGRIDEAISQFNQALQIDPQCLNAYNNIAKAFLIEGKTEEAVASLTELLRLKPDYPNAVNNLVRAVSDLGIMLQKQGKIDQAVEKWKTVLEFKPEDASAHHNIGLAMNSKGKYDQAIKHFNEALRVSPDWHKPYGDLGLAYMRQGKYELAIKNYNEALRLKPDYLNAHYNLGCTYYRQGKVNLAVSHWVETVRLKPDFVEVLNNLAWILATTKEDKIYDPVQAVEYAKRACELTNYKQPRSLDTLAAAYAAASRFDQAIETAEKALELTIALGQKNLAERIQNRLLLYKSSRPYRKKLSSHDKVIH